MKYKIKEEPVLTVNDFKDKYEPTPKTYSIHEAKTNFSKLVKRAQAGETIFIGSHGRAEVILTVVDEKKHNAKLRADAFGCMKGKMKLPKGWDDPWTDEELVEMFGEDILL